MDVAEFGRVLAASPSEPFVRTMARFADEVPDFVAITCHDDSITRRQLEQRSNRLAHVFVDKGARFGDYVAIALPNGIDFYIAFFATLKVGAVPLPLSYRLPVAERQAIIDLAKAALLVGVSEDDHPGCVALPAGFVPDPSVSDDPLPEVVSPAWKAPTSGGSTGRPKIIRAGTGAEGSPAINQIIFRYTSEDTQAVVAPLYHNSALGMSVGGLLLGQHIVVAKKFDAEETLRLIEKHKITWLMLVPTMMHRMHRIIEAGGHYDLSSIRTLLHLASKCPEWLKEKWIELLGPEKIVEIYGGTESIAITRISGEEWLQHRGSVGRPFVGDMKVLDAAGNELPPGQVGEIYMRGADGMGRAYEYVGAEAKTRDGWETLGDLGSRDEDGYIYINDRRTDMIVSGGANVYPAEVENAIDQHPKVLSSVVVGVPDDDLVQRVHAIVQAELGTTAQEILDFLADKLVRYKIPRSVEFMDQPLRDDAGKVRRSQMRAKAIERMKEPMPESTFERIRYDVPVDRVARITLARPETRNAQDYQMLHELDTAFQKATTDDNIRVIVLAADGPHFSSGHDLKNPTTGADFDPHCMTGGYLQPGQAGGMANEEEFYLGMCWRWRNVPKPTIAQVQGKVIAGGLMLVWPCDLIIASEDATFADPTVAFAVNGLEYHTHTWELGARKAKEMLFRGNALTARECEGLGMINHVVPRDDLEKFTLEMASEIAQRPAFGLKLSKMSVNGALEAQGQFNAIRHAFALHQTGHANARAVFDGLPVDPSGIEVIRQLSKSS